MFEKSWASAWERKWAPGWTSLSYFYKVTKFYKVRNSWDQVWKKLSPHLKIPGKLEQPAVTEPWVVVNLNPLNKKQLMAATHEHHLERENLTSSQRANCRHFTLRLAGKRSPPDKAEMALSSSFNHSRESRPANEPSLGLRSMSFFFIG